MSKYIRTYETLCPDDPVTRNDPRRGAIMAEMRAIHKAKNDEDAADVIDWWQVWQHDRQLALEFVREARRMMSNVQGQPTACGTDNKEPTL